MLTLCAWCEKEGRLNRLAGTDKELAAYLADRAVCVSHGMCRQHYVDVTAAYRKGGTDDGETTQSR